MIPQEYLKNLPHPTDMWIWKKLMGIYIYLWQQLKNIINIYGKRYLGRCPSISCFSGFAYVVENINDNEGKDEKMVIIYTFI